MAPHAVEECRGSNSTRDDESLSLIRVAFRSKRGESFVYVRHECYKSRSNC